MNITVENNALRLTFAYHAEIVARCKLIGGATWDKEQRCWYVPLQQADKVARMFPKAAYDFDAIGAVLDAEKQRTATFAAGLIRMGVRLRIDASGAVCAVGDGVSPVLADMVAQRSDDLRAWVDIAMPVVTVTDDDVARNATPREKQSHVTKGDRLIHAGMQNAAKREAEKAQWAQRGRVARRRGIEQAELFGDGMAQAKEGG